MNYQITQVWQSLNALTGQPIGTEFSVQNQGRPGDILLSAVSTGQPAVDFYGSEITHESGYNSITSEGTQEVWVRYYRRDTNPYPARTLRVDVQSSNDINNKTRSIFGGLLTSLTYLARRIKVSINPQLMDGNKAITTQGFTELNSKLGNQFEAAFYQSPLPVGQSLDLIVEVGSSADLLIKDITTQFTSLRIQTQVFVNPTYTGGTELVVYNLNDRDATPDDVTLLAGATVTDTGTQVAPTITTIGIEGQGNRVISTVSMTIGAERVMAAGENYLYRITNMDDVNPTDISGLATWYQGLLSTQDNPDGLG